ncbi:DUF6611 family protein [Gordonia sp. PKS22-38]|uniref:DUF6611 family protein n=1 Tax=Gordonia prachuapensis TaxID=3115651 RepID=A0ABU7MTU7_9ACTN|nr:DUF6611 family protein [Gordonia sp. PKS22-38]
MRCSCSPRRVTDFADRSTTKSPPSTIGTPTASDTTGGCRSTSPRTLTSVPRNHLLDLVDALRRNDADLRHGRITPAQHGAIWARCYDQLI